MLRPEIADTAYVVGVGNVLSVYLSVKTGRIQRGPVSL